MFRTNIFRAFADVFYVIFIPEGRAKAAVGGQFASSGKASKVIIPLNTWSFLSIQGVIAMRIKTRLKIQSQKAALVKRAELTNIRKNWN